MTENYSLEMMCIIMMKCSSNHSGGGKGDTVAFKYAYALTGGIATGKEYSH